MAILFDGAARRITLTAGTVELDVKDLYSRWKDWFAVTDNGKSATAFASVGGEPIVTGESAIPAYIYLTNGWRIQPQEADHTLEVVNGVLLVSGGGDPFVDTAGAFVVRVNYQQPVQAIAVATGGSGATAAQVWQRVIEDGRTAEEMLRIIMAAVAGLSSGAVVSGPSTYRYRDAANTKDRIVSDGDGLGNRNTVTLDGSV